MSTIAESTYEPLTSLGSPTRGNASHNGSKAGPDSDTESLSPSDGSSNREYQEGDTPPSEYDCSSNKDGFPLNTNKQPTFRRAADLSLRRSHKTVPPTIDQSGRSVTSKGVSRRSTRYDGRERRLPRPTNQEGLSVAVSGLSARRSIIRSNRDTRLRKNIRNPLAPTDFESRDSSGHGASPFEFRWMAPPIGIANMTTAATGNAGRSTFTGNEERTFENCVEEAWKLDVYSSSEAETSTVGRSREEETDTPLSHQDSYSEAQVLAAAEPSQLQTTGLLTKFSGPRWRSGRTLGQGTNEETNQRSVSPYPQWLTDAWEKNEVK